MAAGMRFLQLFAAVLAFCFVQARSDYWHQAYATFYGGADGAETMGKPDNQALTPACSGTIILPNITYLCKYAMQCLCACLTLSACAMCRWRMWVR